MSEVPAFALPTGSGELHERDFELAALETAIVDAKAGESRVVLIEGPAGIGKSRLLLEARSRGDAAGFNVLSARGNEFEREFGFGVVRQLFDQAYRSANGNGVFEGPAAAAAAVFDAVPGEAKVAGDGASFAILHGLYWAVANLSEQQPTMLAVDDLHWADMPSLHFLSYLSRRLESMPLVVVATLRPGESGADSTAVRELMSDPARLSVAPGPLSPQAVAAVIEARLGAIPDAEFASACQKATDGNPLLLEELLKETAAAGVSPVAANVATVQEIGPRAASRAVLLRLARLDECCLQVARALTVLGESVPLSTVAELAGTTEAGAAEAVRKCAEVEILRPEAPVGFVHPMVREVVYRDIPPGERELMHERAARLLQSLKAPAERVAAQLLHVPPRGDEWVAQTLRTAAAFATGKGATSSAITYLERALAEPPPGPQRIEVLRDLGLAEALANRIECVDHLQQVYDALDDPLQRGWMAFILGRVFGYADRAIEAEQILQRTFPDLGDEHALLRHRLETVRMSVAYIDPDVLPLDFISGIIDAWKPGGDTVEDRMREGAVTYGMAMRNDPSEDCVRVALDAVADGQLYELDPAGFPIIGVLVVLALADSDAVIDVYRKIIAAGHRGGSVLAPAAARAFGGFAMTLRGDLQEAKELLDTATADVVQFDVQMGRSQLAAFNAVLYAEMGDLEKAERLLNDARDDLPEG
ncbi:MAG: AAA family ATPase, partial [Actinobacteria bacterium]|nr:AAA family ATPase [Actinomycetota bacterium]